MGRADKPGTDVSGPPGEFLARWSRRKIEVRDATGEAAGTDTSATADTVLPPAAEAVAPLASQPEQELTDADMPPLETLDADSDYAPFMSPGVSDGLRQKALRILFNQPACNITDGLNDYDDDYTQFAGLGSIVTHEMKRMLKRELEAENNRQQQAGTAVQESRSAGADMSAAAPVDPSPEADAGTGDAALTRAGSLHDTE